MIKEALEEVEDGIKNNFRYADDTVLLTYLLEALQHLINYDGEI